MIRVENLTFRYSSHEDPVLRRLNLEIQPGEYLALTGPNGCGKTTFGKHLNALLIATQGSVWVDEMDAADPHHWTQIRQRVGMVFQNPDHQIVSMTVEEDIAFGPGNLGLPSPEIQARVRRSLEAVGMERSRHRSPHTLSGGEKRLIAIAGVLAMNPRYIVLDEPTSDLDPRGRRMVLETIGQLNRQGIAIIHITHQLDEIGGAHRLIVMDHGQIVLQGRAREVLRQVERLKALGLEVPPVSELMWRLREIDPNVSSPILTPDEAFTEILAFRARSLSSTPSEEKGNGRL